MEIQIEALKTIFKTLTTKDKIFQNNNHIILISMMLSLSLLIIYLQKKLNNLKSSKMKLRILLIKTRYLINLI